jgi:hypothetical protein
MMANRSMGRYEEFVNLGQGGRREDVDTLMTVLSTRDDFATTRLVDFALGLVRTQEGTERVRHYLFNGSQIQRNYAALHFKRRGWVDLLEQAVALGSIDREQAFSK